MISHSVFIVRLRRERKEKNDERERKSDDAITLTKYVSLSILFFSALPLAEKAENITGYVRDQDTSSQHSTRKVSLVLCVVFLRIHKKRSTM